MTPFLAPDVYCPSLPSSPDSETPSSQSATSFPELADMRFDAGITGNKANGSDPSKEVRKLEVNMNVHVCKLGMRQWLIWPLPSEATRKESSIPESF
jgi:hypothetical protein